MSGWIFFDRIVKTAFYIFRESFLKKTFVWNKLCVHRPCSGSEWKVFGRIVKTAFYIFRGTLWESFFWKEPLYLYFSSGLVGKFFGSLVKTKFYCSRGTFLEKFLFWKKYRFIDFLRASGDNFLTEFSKLKSTFCRSFFWEKKFVRKVLSNHECSSSFGWVFLWEDCQNCCP